MKIAHLISPGASPRQREQQLLDSTALGSQVELLTLDLEIQSVPDGGALRGTALVHVYGDPPFPLLRAMRIPWIGDREPAPSRLPWRRVPSPAVPSETFLALPESVDDQWLEASWSDSSVPLRAGSLRGGSRSETRRLALARIARFRDDVEWEELRTLPDPAAMVHFSLWVDPGLEDDGGGLEALALGMPLVAARTPIAMQRTEGGATGWLVPPGDGNELAHAVLGALFRPETMRSRVDQAAGARRRFSSRERVKALLSLYRRAAG